MALPASSSHTIPQSAGSRVRGILLMCAALACFALLDTFAKVLSNGFSTGEIVFVRYAVHLVLVMIIFAVMRDFSFWKTKQLPLQILRGLTLIGATAGNFFALRYLQLAEAVSIMFSTPLLVAAMAGPLLGEWIGPRRWTAVLIGFSGVLLVTRPGLGGIHWAAIFSLCAAVSYALYAIVTRTLMSRGETLMGTQFWGALVGTVGLAPFLPDNWVITDDPISLSLMLGMGVMGGFGHWLLTLAHRMAPAPVLSPFIYTQMIWMIILGYLVFSDVPNIWTIAGAAIVIASGLYLLWRERATKETQA